MRHADESVSPSYLHKVNTDHVILRQLDEVSVELAFIDTAAKSDQHARLWAKESEGV